MDRQAQDTGKNSKKQIISIIGGGASGIVIANQLIKDLASSQLDKSLFSVLLFEKSQDVGTGLPYSLKQSKTNLMNSPATVIGIQIEDFQDFYKWLISNKEKWQHEFPEITDPAIGGFYPRRLIGMYFNDRAKSLQEFAQANGISYEIIHKEVVDMDIREQTGEYTITTLDGSKYEANYAVMCTGNVENQNYTELMNCKGYFPYFYEHEQKILQEIQRVKSILIIGSRLSAVDAVVLLAKNGFKGKIAMASREGILPSVRDEWKVNNLKYLNRGYLKSLTDSGVRLSLDLFLEHYQKTLSEEIFNRPVDLSEMLNIPDTKEHLRSEIDAIESKKAVWQKIHATITVLIDVYWQQFNDNEKYTYLTKYNNQIIRFINTMPVQNAKLLLALLDSSQLSVNAGLSDVEYNTETHKFTATFNHKDQARNEDYDLVINASGLSPKLPESSKLYQNLEDKDLVKFNFFGSLDAKDNGQINSEKTSNIYSIGQPSFGTTVVVNFLLICAQQAEKIAADIMEKAKTDIKNFGIVKL